MQLCHITQVSCAVLGNIHGATVPLRFAWPPCCPVAGYFRGILRATWPGLSPVPACRWATVTIPSPLLPTRQPQKCPNGGQILKNIQTRGVHMPAAVTGKYGTQQRGPHLPLWFKLLLSGLICLLLFLSIDSSWHPQGTAYPCHSICHPPPAALKSLWHESIRWLWYFLMQQFTLSCYEPGEFSSPLYFP